MTGRQARRGLVLVVGPSGAGKDTLIAGARTALIGESTYVFPQREITRPAGAGGEEHIAVTAEEFCHRHQAGRYALAWQAHGLSYGVPAAIVDALAAGNTVVVNVSRTIIADARRRFGTVHVARVSVDEAALRRRLAARGREDDQDIEARVARAAAYAVCGPNEIAIDNNGPSEQAVAAFVAFLRSLQPVSA
jgi:phosphonate metabolism protein PhnN/1,5-bisphosphokinase (PRPP-forming)